MAMSLVQGGSGFLYIAPPMYDYLCGIDILSITLTLDDVPSCDVRKLLQQVVVHYLYLYRQNVHPSMLNAAFFLQQIDNPCDDRALQEVCSEGMVILLESGHSKPITTITELIRTLIFHYTLYCNKAVSNILGVAQAMAKYPDILQPFLLVGNRHLLLLVCVNNMLL